jgi:hypothetical protein
MRLLMWSFLRRGWLRACAAGVAVGLSVLAIVSYTVIADEIRRRAEFVFSGSMPADGRITLSAGRFDPEGQRRVAQAPTVTGCAFTALVDVILPSGPGQLEGVDFADPFFSFPLAEGRLPSAEGEAIVDASLGELAVFKVGSLLTLRKGVTATLGVRVVGVLDPAARAPGGVLVARSYCLSEAAGGRLARVWVRLRGGADPGGWPPSRCSCRQPRCSSSA